MITALVVYGTTESQTRKFVEAPCITMQRFAVAAACGQRLRMGILAGTANYPSP
jgi:hypothetical protein